MKVELETLMSVLSGKGKGAKGKAPRGLERKKMWEEVRALRKEYVLIFILVTCFINLILEGIASGKAASSRLY